MNTRVKKLCYAIIIRAIVSPLLLADSDDDYKWQNISGNWKIISLGNKTYLTETSLKSYRLGYSELINANSIVTLNSIDKYSKIVFSSEFQNIFYNNANFTIVFSMKENRQFWGFRFEGGKESINRVKFIRSEIIDNSKSNKLRWNYKITSIDSKELNIQYNMPYDFEIRFFGKKVDLLLNRNSILISKIDDLVPSGKIGFSSTFLCPIIGNFTVYDSKNVVFNDDFKQDKIKQYRVSGKIKKIEK